MPLNRLPRATYRLQLRADFGFEAIAAQLPYLQNLGISDLYLSPFFHAREESPHGYDVVDHNRIEPAFGDRAQLRDLARQAAQRNMGILLDIVPNHMGINDPDNLLWNDVLQYGPQSQAAKFFDIDWNPPGGDLVDCVLLPFLGRPFGETLESGELQVGFTGSEFEVRYFDRRFPLRPASWRAVLELSLERLHDLASDRDWGAVDEEQRDELASITTQLSWLEQLDIDRRYREVGVVRRRLRSLLAQSPAAEEAVRCAVKEFNGQPGSPRSFDRLEALLHDQYFRLAYWQVAVDEINYRRFFDINDLAAVRVDTAEVFEHLHRLTFELIAEGSITGLRVDHIDGLLDPEEYFDRLQHAYRQCVPNSNRDQSLYIVAEKILSGDEQLATAWEISGSTGYEFLNQLSAILVDVDGLQTLRESYRQLVPENASNVGYRGKLAILHDAMASELAVLAARLFRLARDRRGSVHFTLRSLLWALRETIACFTVYRTYIRPEGWDVTSEDHRRIREAIRRAIIRNPTMSRGAFEYISQVLLLEFPPDLDEEGKIQWRDWALRFQQVTSPVTAKGIEDTAFYRYYPLLSLNEVGAELDSAGSDPETFYSWMLHRARDWPAALSTTATHDSKRGEDVRARLHVLSECADEFLAAFRLWNEDTHRFGEPIENRPVPDTNERWFIFQTLIGTWPITRKASGGDNHTHDVNWTEYAQRMLLYFEKAFREAKQHTSWRIPNQAFEEAIAKFVSKLLQDRTTPAFEQVDRLARRIAPAGYVNSISQLVLKVTLPGVPDFYQGNEFWDFHLVDPDNRGAVDFAGRRSCLENMLEVPAMESLAARADSWAESLKLWLTQRLLAVRHDLQSIFAHGDLQPLEVSGSRAKHLLAFRRTLADSEIIVLVARLPWGLLAASSPDAKACVLRDFCGATWGDTCLQLPSEPSAVGLWERLSDRRWSHVPSAPVSIAEAFAALPAAILTRNQ